MQETQSIKKKEVTMKKVFVSYHYTALDLSANGFGNYLADFNPEGYEDDPASFILDLEETIARVLEEKIGKEAQVKVMFFR